MSYSPTGSYPTGLTSPTDKRIGDAFPIIEEVYKHLPHLKYLAENANSLVTKQIELRGNTSLQSIEWAYQGTDEWFTLIAFTDLTGGIAIDDLINNLSQLLNDAKTYINDQRINQPVNITATSNYVYIFGGDASTPTKVDQFPVIKVCFSKPTKLKLTINFVHSMNGQIGLAQAGLFINNSWAVSSYLPWSTAVGGQGIRMTTITLTYLFSAGDHTIELGVVKAATAEEFRIGEVGMTYSVSVSETD